MNFHWSSMLNHGPVHYNIGDRRHDDVLMQVLVPNHILKQHPSMAASLMANQDKLLGPYDIYEVLHWIATGAGTSLHPLRTIPADEVWQTHFVDEEGKTKEQPLTFPLPPLNGTNIPHNFFKSNVSPSRSCKEAGLPKNIWRPWCCRFYVLFRITCYCTINQLFIELYKCAQ